MDSVPSARQAGRSTFRGARCLGLFNCGGREVAAFGTCSEGRAIHHGRPTSQAPPCRGPAGSAAPAAARRLPSSCPLRTRAAQSLRGPSGCGVVCGVWRGLFCVIGCLAACWFPTAFRCRGCRRRQAERESCIALFQGSGDLTRAGAPGGELRMTVSDQVMPSSSFDHHSCHHHSPCNIHPSPFAEHDAQKHRCHARQVLCCCSKTIRRAACRTELAG